MSQCLTASAHFEVVMLIVPQEDFEAMVDSQKGLAKPAYQNFTSSAPIAGTVNVICPLVILVLPTVSSE